MPEENGNNNSEFIIQCWNCLGEFDAAQSVWCSCDPKSPTKLCPFCLQCFCASSETYKSDFWQNAPPLLLQELNSLRSSTEKLGDLLIKSNLLTTDQLIQALKEQKERNIKLGEALVNLGFVSKENVEYFLKKQEGKTKIDPSRLTVNIEQVQNIGLEYCIDKLIVPLDVEIVGDREILSVAAAATPDMMTVDFLQDKTSCQIDPFLLSGLEIKGLLKAAFPAAFEEHKIDSSGFKKMANQIIAGAINNKASDIYVEPKENDIQVHYRIDGTMFKCKPYPISIRDAIISELKKMGGMDISDSESLQTGSTVLKYSGEKYEFNMQAIPTPFGQNINMKIINRSRFIKSLDKLGMRGDNLTLLSEILNLRHGLVLISGPFMNGTVTTMYSLMNHLAETGKNISSLECPVYTPLENVQQVQYKEGQFDIMLQSILGNYPDAVFLSELNTKESASKTCKAGIRFPVFALIEANNAGSAIRELLEQGVPEKDVAESLKYVISQKLVRMICPDCKKAIKATIPGLTRGGLGSDEMNNITAFSGEGCPSCRQTGYQGRSPVFEILKINDEIKQLVLKNASMPELYRAALNSGMKSFRESILEMIGSGITTVEEFEKGHF